MENPRISPFLTFTGKAEEAMRFYAANLPDAKITKLVRYGKDHPFAGENEENNVLYGALSLMGQKIMFLDMDSAHPAPDFSWSASIYVDCRDEAEFDTIFGALSQDGVVMMGPEICRALSEMCLGDRSVWRDLAACLGIKYAENKPGKMASAPRKRRTLMA